MMNKKALMLKFLGTMLIALVIFIPACLMVSKLWRLSDQGKESFKELVEIIENFADDSTKDHQSYLLKMDAKTFIAAFTQTGERILLDQETDIYLDTDDFGATDLHTTSSDYYFSYPSICGGGACICLCQDIEEEILERELEIGRERGMVTYDASLEFQEVCPQLLCKSLEETNLEQSWSFWRKTEEEPRRIQVDIVKEDDKISLSTQ
jgi:hypothetical protein